MYRNKFYFYLLLLVLSDVTLAKPFIPEHDYQVLEQLPRVLFRSVESDQIKQLRVLLKTDSNDWQTARPLAQHYIDLAHDQSDPRYMGYAQAVLKPWWRHSHPPVQALIMRAEIKQYEHDFQGALADLDQLLQLRPYHVQANLMKATIATVQGHYKTAIQHCRKLLRRAPLVLALSCQSTPSSLSGHAQTNYRILKQVLPVAVNLEAKQQRWAWTALAEMAWRLGQFDQAEQHFQTALQTTVNDTYLLKVYADFLLQQHRPEEIIKLLAANTQTDTLLLRLALAEQMTDAPQLQQHIALLQERFDANRKRGSNLHQADQARFSLLLINKPQQALQLAQQNWRLQRESSDTYILLQAALAVNDKETIQQVKQWLSKQGTDDVLINQILAAGEEYEI